MSEQIKEEQVDRIITLCGSVRFKSEWEKANYELSKRGWIVLTVSNFDHVFFHSENDEGDYLKRKFDALHKRRINISQTILVLDLGGYVGKSTRSEIEFAQENNKQIYYFSDLIRQNAENPYGVFGDV